MSLFDGLLDSNRFNALAKDFSEAFRARSKAGTEEKEMRLEILAECIIAHHARNVASVNRAIQTQSPGPLALELVSEEDEEAMRREDRLNAVPDPALNLLDAFRTYVVPRFARGERKFSIPFVHKGRTLPSAEWEQSLKACGVQFGVMEVTVQRNSYDLHLA